MAIISCPECGKEVSTHADFCPHCGYKDLQAQNNINESVNVENNSNCEKVITSTPDNDIKDRSMKKSILRVIIGAFITLVVVVSIFILVTYNNNRNSIFGTWIASSEKGEASVTFTEKDGVTTGTITLYDYSESEWDSIDFTVKDTGKYMMTVLTENGEMLNWFFAKSKNYLVLDNVKYTNDKKNSKYSNNSTNKYVIDGIEMPVFHDVYFGMPEEEFKKTSFYTENKSSYLSDYLDLPDWYSRKMDGYISTYFNDDDELSSISFCFYYDSNCEKVKNENIAALSKQYGEYTTHSWSTESYTDYEWKSGSLEVVLTDKGYGEGFNIDYRTRYSPSN